MSEDARQVAQAACSGQSNVCQNLKEELDVAKKVRHCGHCVQAEFHPMQYVVHAMSEISEKSMIVDGFD